MHSSNGHSIPPPPLFSTVRIVGLLSSLLVALASGTNYVFSAYGPQLSARLKLSHTQLNVVGLAGNIGVYGTAPLWGKLVDARGPRVLLVIGFVSLLTGYLGIRHFYDTGKDAGLATLCVLIFCSFLTGIGGNGGLASAMNVTAKSWPDRLRATTTGLVISGFGLSAFLFSTIAHVVYPGDTSEFLLLLAIGTSLPMIWGFFFVRPIPLPHAEATHILEHGHGHGYEEIGRDDEDDSEPSPVFARGNNSRTHLLKSDDVLEEVEEEEIMLHRERRPSNEEGPPTASGLHTSEASDFVVPGSAGSVALGATSPSRSRHRSRSAFSISRRSVGSKHKGLSINALPNIRGMALAISQNFWLLFTITSLLSGTGIMYINNVGSISQALFANGNTDYDEVKAAQLQALQVSTISVMNCVGRVMIGLIADATKHHLKLPRSFCMSLVSTLFIIAQVVLYNTDSAEELWKASALLGLAYGSLFGLFPTITIEWFGLPHFSENWGFVSLSPMIGGNIFSIAFGANLDAHATPPASPEHTSLTSSLIQSRAGLPSDHQCLDGRVCYVDSLKLTIGACCLALILSVYAGWRDRDIEGTWRGRAYESESEDEVLFEGDED
ncbi:MFS general substrate transporter [Panus rudis PR-1116 ss-1]|nr:MFS general substrate transporter [Panus rudis PR-1116 ss-1]